MYRIPAKPRVVDGNRRSYGGTVRDEALRLKLSAPVKVQKSKVSGSFRNKLKNLQKNIRAISKSTIINYRKEKLSTSKVDVVGRVLNKVDDQSEYLMLHNSRPHAYQGYERSQDMYDS